LIDIAEECDLGEDICYNDCHSGLIINQGPLSERAQNAQKIVPELLADIRRYIYLAIACKSFAHPMIPSRAEKNAELKTPIRIK